MMAIVFKHPLSYNLARQTNIMTDSIQHLIKPHIQDFGGF